MIPGVYGRKIDPVAKVIPSLTNWNNGAGITGPHVGNMELFMAGLKKTILLL